MALTTTPLSSATGPLNDLYHLPDSVFNDDNFHTVLTSFDMLILRAYYAPELQSGMNEAEAARRLPAALISWPTAPDGSCLQPMALPRWRWG